MPKSCRVVGNETYSAANCGFFCVKRPAISKHIANIYKLGELDENSAYSILEYMGNDEKQLYTAKAYNLHIVRSVGSM